MLSDPKEKISLLDLYKILSSDKIDKILTRENMNIQEGMTASMRISMEAAFRRINGEDDEALDLFQIVSMFPGGILAKDLDVLWTELRSKTNKKLVSGFNTDDAQLKDITWHRAH